MRPRAGGRALAPIPAVPSAWADRRSPRPGRRRPERPLSGSPATPPTPQKTYSRRGAAKLSAVSPRVGRSFGGRKGRDRKVATTPYYRPSGGYIRPNSSRMPRR